MTGIVDDVVAELKQANPERVVTFAVGPIPDCEADPVMIHAVWRKLLENAVKFTAKRKRALISIEADEPEGSSDAAAGPEDVPEGSVVYRVEDNGVGFDPRHQKKLFTPFRRLHSQDQFPGTGVGLTLVQRIVHRHGGRVWAEGRPGEGATFFFSLPKAGPPDSGDR